MSKRPPIGTQTDTINRYSPFVQQSLDLNRQDAFVTGLGVDLNHYKAMPSPIGQNDRGDYRRNDGVDTITSNGMIYRCAGKFTATMTDNDRKDKKGSGGSLSPAYARLVMPRFYNEGGGVSNGKRIYLAPGDRLYFSDPDADEHVVNYEKINYSIDTDDMPMFPICKVEGPIVDSRNIEYVQGTDFIITDKGNIRWVAGGNNPGIDPETGKGRVYSIRYLYKAYYYVMELLKEVRVTNVTTNGVRSPERMPYHALIVREYIYHNQNKGDSINQLKPQEPNRANAQPQQKIDPASPFVPVEMTDIEANDPD